MTNGLITITAQALLVLLTGGAILFLIWEWRYRTMGYSSSISVSLWQPEGFTMKPYDEQAALMTELLRNTPPIDQDHNDLTSLISEIADNHGLEYNKWYAEETDPLFKHISTTHGAYVWAVDWVGEDGKSHREYWVEGRCQVVTPTYPPYDRSKLEER